jgi:hypothetical protein
MRRLALTVVLASVAVAGCIASETDEAEPASTEDEARAPWYAEALEFGPGHDHTDPADHRNLSTPNFNLLGYSPLTSEHYGQAPGSYFCGDTSETEDGRQLAAVESRSQVGFALADVTDPAEPEWLGELVMDTTRIYDLAVVPDGEHVVLVTSYVREDRLTEPPAADAETRHDGLLWDSRCTGQPIHPVWAAGPVEEAHGEVPRPMSILLVDITDPAEPTITDQQPLLASGHSVFADRIDGEDWVMATTTRVPNAGTPGVDENSVSTYQFYRVQEDPARNGRLETVSAYKRPPDDDGADIGPRGHDGWLAEHPKTGELTAYLAGGDRFAMLDMSDPNNPTRVGSWEVEGPGTPASGEGTLHHAYPLPELWNGTHYTIVGPEHAGHPEGAPTGVTWVLDTTDPADPHPVAAWTLPVEVDWNGTYMFSPHYATVVDETLFSSMYHGGIWAIDLSPLADGNPDVDEDGLVHLQSTGAFVPGKAPPGELAEPSRWTPTFEEALAQPDGTLVTFSNAGAFTLEFDASDPMPKPAPWNLDDAIVPPSER